MKEDGPKLPQKHAPDSLPKAKKLGSFAAEWTLKAAYKSLQPQSKEAFSRTPDLKRLKRIYCTTEDGWQLPVYCLPVRETRHAEPVLLAPSWGQNHHSLQFRKRQSLAWHLQAAGYAVFLLSHRGSREAISPGRSTPWDFDDVVQWDIPAILDAILERVDCTKVHWVGHGFGGQLLYGHLANEGAERIASASTICAPVRFESPPTRAKALGFALRFLPGELSIPTRAFGKLVAPALSADGDWMEQLGHRQTEGDMARGMLLHGTENVSTSLIRQVLTWTERGFLSDRHGHQDVAAALEGERIPLQIIATEGDRLCPPEAAFAVEDFWDGPIERLRLDAGWGHQDPILAEEAKLKVFPRIENWLNKHRLSSHQKAIDAVEVEPTPNTLASRLAMPIR